MTEQGSTATESLWQRERDNRVAGPVIRPKIRSVKGQGAASKRDLREVFDLRRCLTWIQTSNTPILIPLLGSAQDIDRSIDKHMSGDLSADIESLQDVSGRIELEDPMLVPLTQIKIAAIVAEI